VFRIYCVVDGGDVGGPHSAAAVASSGAWRRLSAFLPAWFQMYTAARLVCRHATDAAQYTSRAYIRRARGVKNARSSENGLVIPALVCLLRSACGGDPAAFL